ncbi:hypothetical protein DOY81_007444, partial [Sarcophaga bullata]
MTVSENLSITTTITTIATTTTTDNMNSTSFNILARPQQNLNATIPANLHNSTYVDDDIEDNSSMLCTVEMIGTVLSFYYVPIIVGIGSIGNILSVFVFFKTKLSKLSSSFYLAALAVSDTCFLLGLFAQWLNFVDVHIYNREYFCQFFTFFIWFVVAFTVERFIAVMYPLKRQTMCTVKRAKMVLIGLTILGCLHCAPFWISSTLVHSPKFDTPICDIRTEYKEYITLLNYWDTFIVFAVPFTTIVILNTFTGCTVWRFATIRRSLTMQKMTTQHLSPNGTMLSNSSTFCHRDSSTMATAMTTSNSLATTTTVSTTTANGQQEMSQYRMTMMASLKRQNSTTSSAMQLNGQHHYHNIAGHLHQYTGNQQNMMSHHNHHRTDTNRATIVKHNTTGSRDYGEIFLRKSRKRKITNSTQMKVTKMLLIVSTVFVCLNLPSFIMRMITYLETQSSANEKTTIVLQYIFQLLFITNFGINFVLYCASGQNFRKAALSMFRKGST